MAYRLTRAGRFDKLLLSLNEDRVDPLEKNPDDGNTALHTVIQYPWVPFGRTWGMRHRAFKELLAKVKRNCSPQNDCQETPLHIAIRGSHTKEAIMLIEAGADLSLRDNLERTPLDLAKELAQDDVVAAIQEALEDDAGGEHHEVSRIAKQKKSL